MNVRAYVLIQTEVGRADQVANLLADIEGVVAADNLTGPYDVIAVVAADSMDELGRLVVSQIQLTEGITQTTTCPVVNL